MGGGTTVAASRGFKVTLWVVGIVLLGVVLFFPTAIATDQAGFCRTCHEMVPYYDAWKTGKHAEKATCIDCHVDAGLPARFSHKFVALGEVKAHFLGDTTFPRPTAAEVPNRRCLRCHTPLPATTEAGFSHKIHAEKGTCATCHPMTGHNVTPEALKSAGVFNPAVKRAVKVGEFATVDAGSANIPGHPKVGCSRCHDMAKTGCARCHAPKSGAKHPWKGDCSQCHEASAKFAFKHTASTDCAKCHKPSDKHFKPASGKLGPCKECHPTPGGTWKFTHGGSGSDCASCHKPPANHYSGQCSQCHHKPGSSWSFSHPSAGEHSWKGIPCEKCHPKSYTAAFCTCHGGNAPND
jgi:nitrate/TMAO reductase-like tetraheme cytochrome c subunit